MERGRYLRPSPMPAKSLNVLFQRIAGCLASLTAVAGFDYWTGYELSSSPVYLIPVALSFFNFGNVGGYVVAVVAAVAWTLIDKWSGHVYAREYLRWETGFSRFVVFALAVWGLSLYRKTVETHRARLEALRQLLPMCHECGCIRISTGEWKTPEELLAMAPQKPLECPPCSAREDVRSA